MGTFMVENSFTRISPHGQVPFTTTMIEQGDWNCAIPSDENGSSNTLRWVHSLFAQKERGQRPKEP